MLKKIISGGQTGADIAAVDAAIAMEFPYGGVLPKGRRCENGSVPTTYLDFSVSPMYDYRVRTEVNVKIADGTLVFTKGPPTSGTAETVRLTKKHNKPCMVVDVYQPEGMIPTVDLILNFINDNKINVLNVAGPRESKTPGIYNIVFENIFKLLTLLACKL
jgi:hypothetical protein